MVIIYLLCLVLNFIVSVNSKSFYEKLLIVSFDGFRYDYVNLNLTPTLNKLKVSSTYSERLLNVFPTQTFPNHFTLATGVYAEVHGVLANKVYDKSTQSVLTDTYRLWHYNENITPIWTLNEKAGDGRHSGVMMWPGSSFEYNGINSTFRVRFREDRNWKSRVDQVMDWFNHPTTPTNLVMLYFEEPDVDSHIFGPNSVQNHKQIEKTDQIVEYLLVQLKRHNLSDVNVIFLSDHGMEGVTKGNIINLEEIVGDEAEMYGTSPVLQVYPKKGVNEYSIYDKLKTASFNNKNFKVYLQNDIPDHFYYKYCARAPPILAVAEPSYAFQDKLKSIQKYIKIYNASENGTIGIHGYDPSTESMHGYFIAHGPLFKKNFLVPELRTIDMYSLFSHILGLDSFAVETNGTLNNVQHLFNKSTSHPNLIFYCILFCIILLMYKNFKKRKEKLKKNNYNNEYLQSLLMD